MTPRPTYTMFGGFLGAGKTTAVLAYARYLREQGRRVGLITNDQSVGLVDTRLLAHHGFPVEEITGGCFCCRFTSLIEAAEALRAPEGLPGERPDVLIAEPVGSCTDLMATVAYPLRRIYGDDYRVAPLSVVVDPARALRVLGVEEGRAFSPKVVYVYTKQLEEAEILVLNKVDRVGADRLDRLEAALAERFPRARRVRVSAREGTGLTDWFDLLDRELTAHPTMDVDYDTYAAGEALLGWLNATVAMTASPPVDGNALLTDLAAAIKSRLLSAGHQVAHLKMTLTPTEFGGDLGVLNLTADEDTPELSHALREPLGGGELIVNLRAEGDPEIARAATEDALAQVAQAAPGLALPIEHAEHFRPGYPTPTHRDHHPDGALPAEQGTA